MEACSGPHFLGNALGEKGPEVHLMPAQRVDGKMPPRCALPHILEGGLTSLSGTLRFLLAERKQELEQLAIYIDQAKMLILESCAAERSLPAPRYDPRDPPAHGHCTHRRDWMEASARVVTSQPGWDRSPTPTLHRRQAEASRYQQARQKLSTETALFRAHARF